MTTLAYTNSHLRTITDFASSISPGFTKCCIYNYLTALRISSLLILLWILSVLPISVNGQGLDPVPDSLEWKGYFPLQIGNVWEYKSSRTEYPFDTVYVNFRRLHIVDKQVQINTSYFVIKYVGFDHAGVAGSPFEMLVRYDSTTGSVVENALFADGNRREICYMDWLCHLDSDFNTNGWFNADNPEPLVASPDTIINPAYKINQFLLGANSLVHGVGWTGTVWGDEAGGGTRTTLTYARVGELTIGAEVIPTGSHFIVTPEPGIAITAFYPNPVFSEAMVNYTLSGPGSVRISIYNVLGKLIKREMVNAVRGEYSYELSGAGMEAGQYWIEMKRNKGERVSRAFILLP